MSKLKCWRCGEIFKEEDAGVRSENVGEFWGAPAYMEINVCPACGCDELEEVSGEEEDEDE